VTVLFALLYLMSQNILQLAPEPPALRIAYGADPLQFGELRVPPGDGPHPVVIVIHGGFWRAAYNLDHISHLCVALNKAGLATWSLEYRRIGNPGGGWRGTLDDILAGKEHLRSIAGEHHLRSCARRPAGTFGRRPPGVVGGGATGICRARRGSFSGGYGFTAGV
jgi:hypothetical protein